jgi:hypothetical protein
MIYLFSGSLQHHLGCVKEEGCNKTSVKRYDKATDIFLIENFPKDHQILQNFVFSQGRVVSFGGKGVKSCSTMTPKKKKKKKTIMRVAKDFFEKDAKVT